MISLTQFAADVSLAPAAVSPLHPAPINAAHDAELAALVRRAQAGQLGAQSDLVRRYSRRIAGFLRTIVRQPDAIDDVAQMVFIKVVQRLPHLRNAAVFESWLFMLARNTALDFLRRQRRRPVTVTLDELTNTPETASGDRDANEIHEALDLALARLTVTDRSLVVQFVNGESYRAMAERAGLTLGAVKARLHRVRPFLRESVGENFFARAA